MSQMVDCPTCRMQLQVPEELLGQWVRCPTCGKTFTAPAAMAVSVPPPPPRVEPAPSPYAETLDAQAAPAYAPPPPPREAVGFRCPFCKSREVPYIRSQISTAGWVTFVVLLLFCLPLFWIGLLIKEDYRVCSACGMRLGY